MFECRRCSRPRRSLGLSAPGPNHMNARASISYRAMDETGSCCHLESPRRRSRELARFTGSTARALGWDAALSIERAWSMEHVALSMLWLWLWLMLMLMLI